MFVSMTLLSIWRTKGTSTVPRFFYISTLRRNGRKDNGKRLHELSCGETDYAVAAVEPVN